MIHNEISVNMLNGGGGRVHAGFVVSVYCLQFNVRLGPKVWRFFQKFLLLFFEFTVFKKKNSKIFPFFFHFFEFTK
jgi:hypothetical protein